jgi:hypothetical protein
MYPCSVPTGQGGESPGIRVNAPEVSEGNLRMDPAVQQLTLTTTDT